MEKPLDETTVLDLTRNITGSLCTKLLADFGANVIKVEKPGNHEGIRNQPPFYHDEPGPETSLSSFHLNSNKKSITLNIETGSGVKIFKSLVAKADIVAEDFNPGTMERMGLAYDILRKLNPGLLMVSISNFGQSGPYKDYNASEITFEALCGIMYGLGPYDKPPVKNGGAVFQGMAGLAAAGAVLTALHGITEGEQGEHVDFSIAEAIIPAICVPLIRYIYTGQVQRRELKYSGDGLSAVPTKDGFISPLIYGYIDLELLAQLLQEPEIAEPRFASYYGRMMNLHELDPILKRGFANRTKDFFHTGQEWGFGFGAVEDIQDVVKSPQLEARDFFTECDHPVLGKIDLPWPPFKISEDIVSTNPAPVLGQHNQSIYGEWLDFSDDDLVRLNREGVI